MKKFIILFCLILLSLNSSFVYATDQDIANYKIAFSVINEIPCNLTLSQAYVLYALLKKATSTSIIDSIKMKMETSTDLRLSLEEIYAIKKLVDTAPDSSVILIFRTSITQIISDFKIKLAEIKAEAIIQGNTIITIEGIVSTEEL